MLFVPEEEEEQFAVEDPVVSSTPLFLNKLPANLYPLLVQSKTPITHHSNISYKPKSSVMEVQTPLVTDRYFSHDQAEQLGSSNAVLKGVIISNTANDKPLSQNETPSIRSQPGTIGGSDYYILARAEDGSLHLSPTPNTVVVNSDFNHIDEAKSERVQSQNQHLQQFNQKESNSNSNGNGNSSEKKVNVVTMSAKSSKEVLPRLGGALLSSKLEMEEASINLKIGNSEDIKSDLFTESKEPIETTLTKDQYLDSLLNE